MAKHRNFRKKQQEPTEEEHFDNQEGESTPVKLETILLGVVILILVFQTFLMLSDDGNSNSSDPVANNTQQNDPPPPNAAGNNPAMGADANNPAQGDPNNPAEQQPPADDGPKAQINFPETNADLGTVAVGSETQHTFTVDNPGDIDITFGRVYGDEGVTVVSNPETIPAGESGEIVVSYSGSAPGADEKTIHINANTETPHHHLTVTADVQ